LNTVLGGGGGIIFVPSFRLQYIFRNQDFASNFDFGWLMVYFSGPHYFEDLTDMMDHDIVELFNAEFEDNSIEEVVTSPVYSCSA
jgi:hypothetical protein